MRIFIDGEDEASVIAGRFPEMFAGAVLRGADGRTSARPNVARYGQLSGMPAFLVIDPKSKAQKTFAQEVLKQNPKGVIIEDATVEGNPKAIGVWMEKLDPRPAEPREISYTVHDSSFQRHYWINVLDFDASLDPPASFRATADRAKNDVVVDVDGISRFELFLSDALVDLNKPVRVVVMEDDKELPFFDTDDGRDTLTRDVGTMLDELLDSNQPWRVYTVKLQVNVRELRDRAAKKAAAAGGAPPANGAAPAEDGGKPAGDTGKPQSTDASR
jgi:hypothetical protein